MITPAALTVQSHHTSRPVRWHFLVVLLATSACASPPKRAPRPSPARAPSALPRSSIAAVLSHRTELALGDDQVKRLEQMQAELDKKDAEIREGVLVDSGGEASATQPGQQPGEGHQRGRGTGSAGRSRAHGASKRSQGSTASDVERALDEQDTATFLRSEEIFRADQRERAREIAEKYREDLYDEREQAKRKTGVP
jgi:hypothetical protein